MGHVARSGIEATYWRTGMWGGHVATLQRALAATRASGGDGGGGGGGQGAGAATRADLTVLVGRLYASMAAMTITPWAVQRGESLRVKMVAPLVGHTSHLGRVV